MSPETDFLGRKGPRASVEGTLSKICASVRLTSPEQATLMRLLDRQPDWPGQRLVRMPVWRAFYARHPGAMHQARNALLRELAEQLDAETNAAAACRAIDNLLATHGIATTSPK